MSEIIIRLEHPDGSGVFRSENRDNWDPVNMACFDALCCAHYSMPVPFHDDAFGDIMNFSYYCAYENLAVFESLIEIEWFKEMYNNHVRLYEVHIERCLRHDGQAIFLKDDVIEMVDISDKYLTIES